MSSYDPATLGPIDAVDVVALAPVATGRLPGSARLMGDCHEVLVEGRQAEEIARLWRSLPPGEPKRCHVPPFRLRFRRAGSIVVEAGLCWQCNNAIGTMGDEDIGFVFDAEAPVSRQLFGVLNAVLPLAMADQMVP